MITGKIGQTVLVQEGLNGLFSGPSNQAGQQSRQHINGYQKNYPFGGIITRELQIDPKNPINFINFKYTNPIKQYDLQQGPCVNNEDMKITKLYNSINIPKLPNLQEILNECDSAQRGYYGFILKPGGSDYEESLDTNTRKPNSGQKVIKPLFENETPKPLSIKVEMKQDSSKGVEKPQLIDRVVNAISDNKDIKQKVKPVIKIVETDFNLKQDPVKEEAKSKKQINLIAEDNLESKHAEKKKKFKIIEEIKPETKHEVKPQTGVVPERKPFVMRVISDTDHPELAKPTSNSIQQNGKPLQRKPTHVKIISDEDG